jgi:putative transposase
MRKVTRVTRQVQVWAGGVCDLGYHVVWYLKYRPPVRADQTVAESGELIRSRADGRGWRVVALEIMPSHVHLLVNTHSSHRPSRIANQFRGFIPRWLCAEFTHLNGRPQWKERSR